MSISSSTGRPERTRRLLTGGLIAGPLFVAVVIGQILTREGFDLSRHPISLLSVGDFGWIQIANFVVAGLLSLGFVFGVRRTVTAGRGATWGPILLAIYGIGLIAGGVFVADPGLGFPPGTPDGIPATFTWHGTIHAFAPPIAFLALVVACIVFARRFAADGDRGWSTYSAITAAAAFILAIPVPPEGASIRLALAMSIGAAWVSALAMHLLREQDETQAITSEGFGQTAKEAM